MRRDGCERHIFGPGYDCDDCNRCEHCEKPVERLTEWQSFVGQTWRGHRDCAEAEAAKWVLVRRSDLALVLDRFEAGDTTADPSSSAAAQRLREASSSDDRDTAQ